MEPLPLLAPCLKGLAKFSHLIDLDFMDDLMNHLKVLASGSSNSGNTSVKCSKCLTVSERLQCCIVAFRVMRNNLHALNVDLQDFFMHLYNLVLEYRPGRFVLKYNILKPPFSFSFFQFVFPNYQYFLLLEINQTCRIGHLCWYDIHVFVLVCCLPC